MEFNTELILLSDDVSSSITVTLRNTIYSNINYHFYNNIVLSLDCYLNLNDHILFSYVENIGPNNTILNIIKKIKTSVRLSLVNNLLINKTYLNCYIYLLRNSISYFKIHNSIFLLKVNLFNMCSDVTFKSVFQNGCLIPRIDVKSILLVKYYNIIPRLVYDLIRINKRLFYFNNHFLSKKK